MENELPEVVLEGTVFVVDVMKDEIREKANPENIIAFAEMRDAGTHYTINYDPVGKNLPGLLQETFLQINIPTLIMIDPAGMSKKYGKSIQEMEGKTDFEIIIDQDVLHKRLNAGMLPVISIVDHPFYVDLRMGSVRPKDDFSTQGILFSELDHIGAMKDDESAYLAIYNPITHQLGEIDFSSITSLPNDLILIELPVPVRLDPIGYARMHDLPMQRILRGHPPKMEMQARVADWDEIRLLSTINKNNLVKQFKEASGESSELKQVKKKKGIRR